MLTNIPTWTTDRVELLKQSFRSRPHLPRDRSQHRRQPQRRDRQTCPPPVDARPDPRRTAPDQGRQGTHPKSIPRAAVSDAAGRLRKRAAAARRSRSQASAAARCSNSATNGAAGRSARPAPRISAFAATRRWKACPIARATTASPTVPARASALCADRRSRSARPRDPRLRKRVNKEEPSVLIQHQNRRVSIPSRQPTSSVKLL